MQKWFIRAGIFLLGVFSGKFLRHKFKTIMMSKADAEAYDADTTEIEKFENIVRTGGNATFTVSGGDVTIS